MAFLQALRAFVFISLLGCSVSTFASGSFSFGAAAVPQDDYNQGKVLLHKKLICGSCPMASSGLDKASAQQLLSKIEGGDAAGLSPKEQDAVIYYLQERFDL